MTFIVKSMVPPLDHYSNISNRAMQGASGQRVVVIKLPTVEGGYVKFLSRRSRAFLSFRTLLAFLGWLILVYAAPHECFMKLPEAAAPFPSRDSGVFG